MDEMKNDIEKDGVEELIPSYQKILTLLCPLIVFYFLFGYETSMSSKERIKLILVPAKFSKSDEKEDERFHGIAMQLRVWWLVGCILWGALYVLGSEWLAKQ